MNQKRTVYIMWVNVKFREKNKGKSFQGRSKNVSAKNSSS